MGQSVQLPARPDRSSKPSFLLNNRVALSRPFLLSGDVCSAGLMGAFTGRPSRR